MLVLVAAAALPLVTARGKLAIATVLNWRKWRRFAPALSVMLKLLFCRFALLAIAKHPCHLVEPYFPLTNASPAIALPDGIASRYSATLCMSLWLKLLGNGLHDGRTSGRRSVVRITSSCLTTYSACCPVLHAGNCCRPSPPAPWHEAQAGTLEEARPCSKIAFPCSSEATFSDFAAAGLLRPVKVRRNIVDLLLCQVLAESPHIAWKHRDLRASAP